MEDNPTENNLKENIKENLPENTEEPPQHFEIENSESARNESLESSQIESLPFYKEKEPKSSNFQSFINILKTFIGAGILGMPYGFVQAGYLLSTFMIIFIGAVVAYTTHLMLQVIEKVLALENKTELSVVDLFKHTLGLNARKIYSMFLITYQIGVCVAYVIFFTKFFESAFGETDTIDHRLLFLGLSLLIIIPMSFIQNYHFFYKYSRIGNVLIFITLIAIIESISNPIAKENKKNLGSFVNLPRLLGIAVFSFETIGCFFNLRNTIKEPSNFEKIFFGTMFFVVILYAIFGSLCSVGFGEGMNQIVLMDLQKKRGYFLLFQFFYAVALVMSYPLQTFPIVTTIERQQRIKAFIENPPYRILKYLPKFLITCVIFIFGCFVPKFATFLNLVGAFSGTALQFVFPVLIHFSFFKSEYSKKQIIVNSLILIVGIVAGVICVISSFMDMFKNNS